MDLIERQAAIDVAMQELDGGTMYDIPTKIKYLPSAYRWIPCSERLPEEHGEYFIIWTTSYQELPLIGIAGYEVSGEWVLDNYIEEYPNVKVVAWMPLPEPYQEESV